MHCPQQESVHGICWPKIRQSRQRVTSRGAARLRKAFDSTTNRASRRGCDPCGSRPCARGRPLPPRCLPLPCQSCSTPRQCRLPLPLHRQSAPNHWAPIDAPVPTVPRVGERRGLLPKPLAHLARSNSSRASTLRPSCSRMRDLGRGMPDLQPCVRARRQGCRWSRRPAPPAQPKPARSRAPVWPPVGE